MHGTESVRHGADGAAQSAGTTIFRWWTPPGGLSNPIGERGYGSRADAGGLGGHIFDVQMRGDPFGEAFGPPNGIKIDEKSV